MSSFLYLIVYFFTILTSCADDFDEKDDLARLDALKMEVLSLVGEGDCSELAVCRSLALGAKPCGGPWEYLIYSTTNSDTLKINEKVEEYNELNRILNIRYGYLSDCTIVEEPQLVCLDGKCADSNKIERDSP